MRNSFWKTALCWGLFWAVFMTGFKYLEVKTISLEIFLQQLSSGLLFGIMYAFLMKYVALGTNKHIEFDIAPEEKLIKEAGALQNQGPKALEGRLGLTDHRIVFKGNRYDTRKFQFSFNLEHIRNLRVAKPWYLIKNEIRFEYNDGSTLRFGIDDAEGWLRAIERQQAAESILQPGHV